MNPFLSLDNLSDCLIKSTSKKSEYGGVFSPLSSGTVISVSVDGCAEGEDKVKSRDSGDIESELFRFTRHFGATSGSLQCCRVCGYGVEASKILPNLLEESQHYPTLMQVSNFLPFWTKHSQNSPRLRM